MKIIGIKNVVCIYDPQPYKVRFDEKLKEVIGNERLL